jgi:omega-amidase
MQISLVQLDPIWEDKPANFQKVWRLLEHSSPASGGMIVLPEMFSTGFSLDLSKTHTTGAGTEAAFCAELARQFGCCVVGGFVDATANRAGNFAAAFSPDGEIVRYQKRRPFTGAGEQECHAPGSSAVVFKWGGLTVAPLVCYDLRFPELFREALALGANAFIVIAAWPSRRTEHWLTLLRARAIENQAFVIGVNRTGKEPQFSYNGRSAIVDPQGALILDGGESECVVTAEIDPAAVDKWRYEFPAVRDFLRHEDAASTHSSDY